MAIEQLDGEDQTLVFQATDPANGTHFFFSISRERASQSQVFKDMLGLNQERVMNEENAIKLSERPDSIRTFLKSLIQEEWQQYSLYPSSVVNQLQMSDKYQSRTAALWVAVMVRTFRRDWIFKEVILFYHYSIVFNLPVLKPQALLGFLRLKDLSDHNLEDPSIKVASHCLHDLFILRKRFMNRPIFNYEPNVGSCEPQCFSPWVNRIRPSLWKAEVPSQGSMGYLCPAHQARALAVMSGIQKEIETVAFEQLSS